VCFLQCEKLESGVCFLQCEKLESGVCFLQCEKCQHVHDCCQEHMMTLFLQRENDDVIMCSWC